MNKIWPFSLFRLFHHISITFPSQWYGKEFWHLMWYVRYHLIVMKLWWKCDVMNVKPFDFPPGRISWYERGRRRKNLVIVGCGVLVVLISVHWWRYLGLSLDFIGGGCSGHSCHHEWRLLRGSWQQQMDVVNRRLGFWKDRGLMMHC